MLRHIILNLAVQWIIRMKAAVDHTDDSLRGEHEYSLEYFVIDMIDTAISLGFFCVFRHIPAFLPKKTNRPVNPASGYLDS